jgi:hypothetical protein
MPHESNPSHRWRLRADDAEWALVLPRAARELAFSVWASYPRNSSCRTDLKPEEVDHAMQE